MTAGLARWRERNTRTSGQKALALHDAYRLYERLIASRIPGHQSTGPTGRMRACRLRYHTGTYCCIGPGRDQRGAEHDRAQAGRGGRIAMIFMAPPGEFGLPRKEDSDAYV
jgi:hypothetical protein